MSESVHHASPAHCATVTTCGLPFPSEGARVCTNNWEGVDCPACWASAHPDDPVLTAMARAPVEGDGEAAAAMAAAPFTCVECGDGTVRLATGPGPGRVWDGLPIPDAFPLPTCDRCGEWYTTEAIAAELTAACVATRAAAREARLAVLGFEEPGEERRRKWGEGHAAALHDAWAAREAAGYDEPAPPAPTDAPQEFR